MIVVYHDYGGTHSTALAAAIHLGIVGGDGATSIDSRSLLSRVPYFDQVPNTCKGTVMRIGRDSDGNEVFILGRRGDADLAINTVLSAARLLGRCDSDILFVDVSKRINLLMRIGGFISRRLNLIPIGRPIVTYGTRKAFPSISQLVKKTKRTLAQLQ
ncbi:MAG: DUF3189 family protein [Bacillota bacterium]|jgi:hypothetical protein|nr:DUF3189 family protein [Bacillota bacterium]HOB90923.1 DUF3189 family protein [Bacillota bacterium]HPZ55029.1 DUF3189 family protein [Bacillota bacterium]HQD17952.1 DUF3189 family protein [Bacillota bacterium]